MTFSWSAFNLFNFYVPSITKNKFVCCSTQASFNRKKLLRKYLKLNVVRSLQFSFSFWATLLWSDGNSTIFYLFSKEELKVCAQITRLCSELLVFTGKGGMLVILCFSKEKKSQRQMVQGAHIEDVKALPLNESGFASGDSSRSKILLK